MRNRLVLIIFITLLQISSCGKKVDLDRYENSKYPREQMRNSND